MTSFYCPQCGKEGFKTKKSFLSHLRKEHLITMSFTIRMFEKDHDRIS